MTAPENLAGKEAIPLAAAEATGAGASAGRPSVRHLLAGAAVLVAALLPLAATNLVPRT